MITFNPRKFYLKGIDNVDINLKLKNNEKILFPMERTENNIFIFNGNNFINYNYLLKDKKIYPHKIEACIISTMSSGKSTFINSLLGKEIMPSENQACTGKIFKIEKNLNSQDESLNFKENGEIKRYFLNNEYLKFLNSDKITGTINVIANFHSISENITLYDTPGVNNFTDTDHKDITYDFLKSSKIKNIIYILNATQIGVNDDRNFLLDIREIFEKNDFNIVFVLNKIDEIQLEKESIEDIKNNVKKYLEKNGFPNSNVYLTSSFYCKLLRFALNKELKTRNEVVKVLSFYDLYEIEETFNEVVKVGPRELCKDKILKLIELTGVPEVELAIQNINIFSPTFSMRVERRK